MQRHSTRYSTLCVMCSTTATYWVSEQREQEERAVRHNDTGRKKKTGDYQGHT